MKMPNTTPQSPDAAQLPNNTTFTGFITGGVIILALQSLAVNFMWKYVMVAQLSLPPLGFGSVFLVMAVYHVIFRDLFGLFQRADATESENIETLLTDIRDIHIISEKSKSFQYNTTILLMSELIQERNEARELLAKIPNT
jgi:hypothetical protein